MITIEAIVRLMAWLEYKIAIYVSYLGYGNLTQPYGNFFRILSVQEIKYFCRANFRVTLIANCAPLLGKKEPLKNLTSGA